MTELMWLFVVTTAFFWVCCWRMFYLYIAEFEYGDFERDESMLTFIDSLYSMGRTSFGFHLLIFFVGPAFIAWVEVANLIDFVKGNDDEDDNPSD